MGYRHCLYAVPKKQVAEIQACKTNDDWCKFAENYGYKIDWCVDDSGSGWFAPYKISKELYELGKYSEIAFKLESERPSLFTSEELKKRYSDYGFALLTKDDFKTIIEVYRQKIVNWFQSLLNPKDSNKFSEDFTKEQYQFEILKQEVQNKIDIWSGKYCGVTPIDLDAESEQINNSWLYEYAIFELVRLYKIFDWENDELVLVGW